MERSYKDNDPKGWCGDPKRGAAMGRRSIEAIDADYEGLIQVAHVELDEGGYDPNGTYFGTGNRLYWAYTDDGSLDTMLRADSATQALGDIAVRYPRASLKHAADVKHPPTCEECGEYLSSSDHLICARHNYEM